MIQKYFIGHFVKIHFIKNEINNHFLINHKDDKKITSISLCQNYPWHFVPISSKTPRHVGEPQKCKGMNEYAEAWLSVRIGQVS